MFPPNVPPGPLLHPPLYKRGVRGEVRVWRMERFGAAHRVISGIEHGAETASGWTRCEAKNAGRSNATTPVSQAIAEIAALYAIKQRLGYAEDKSRIDETGFMTPMLAENWETRKTKVAIEDGVFIQPKLDGIRCIARSDGLWTRTGKPIVSVPHVVEALVPLFEADPDAVFDGELYAHALCDDFDAIASAVRKTRPKPADFEKARRIGYHLYDMPSAPGDFGDRYRHLLWLLNDHGEDWPLVPVETHEVHSRAEMDWRYAGWLEAGYEGQMVRLKRGGYEHKRSKLLLKRKTWITEEFPVIGMEEGKGNWSGCVKRLLIRLPDGSTGEAAPRGTQAALAALLESGDAPDWATVRHFGYTADGALRFPVAVDYGHGARTD